MVIGKDSKNTIIYTIIREDKLKTHILKNIKVSIKKFLSKINIY
jgi:hypothetical protein